MLEIGMLSAGGGKVSDVGSLWVFAERYLIHELSRDAVELLEDLVAQDEQEGEDAEDDNPLKKVCYLLPVIDQKHFELVATFLVVVITMHNFGVLHGHVVRTAKALVVAIGALGFGKHLLEVVVANLDLHGPVVHPVDEN